MHRKTAQHLIDLQPAFRLAARIVFLFVCVGTMPAWAGAESIGAAGNGDVWFAAVLLSAAASALVAWKLARRHRRQSGRRALESLDQVTSLIEHIDGLLWEAKVELKPGGLEWDISLPTSALSKRIFGNLTPPKTVGLWYVFKVPEREQMDRHAREAIEDGRPAYEQEFRLISEGRTLWIHESVSITPTGPNRFRLAGLAVDITARREAEKARLESEGRMEQLLVHANCMLWQAKVVRNGSGKFDWEWFVPKSELYRRIAGEYPGLSARMPWGDLNVPEFAELEDRSRDAMRRDLPGYEQIFRVLHRGEILWMHEQTRIRRLGENEWSLEGVVIDITAQKHAEEEKQKSEQRLVYLLERADCLIWQARVQKLPDGEFKWSMFIPRSQLLRRLANRDPGEQHFFGWLQMGVPEIEEMKQRSRNAMMSGASGYAQVFHVPKPEGNIWLSERASIRPIEPGQWEVVGIITDITARHDAEEAWRASEARLGNLLDLADCMVWEATVRLITDDSLEWQLYTPQSALYRRVFGSAAQTELNWHLLNVPEFDEMKVRAVEAVRNQDSGYVQEFRVIQNSEVIWLREVVTIQPLPSGQSRLVGVVTDITAQRGAEQAVHASEARYRSLFQHTPVAIIEADFTAVGRWLDELRKEGVRDLGAWLDQNQSRLVAGAALARVTNCNENALRMLRAKSPDDFRRRNVLATSGSLRAIRDTFVAIWEGRNTLEAQFAMNDFEGGEHFMDLRWWVGRNEAGMDLSQSVMVYVDLTDLKKAEAELAAEKERLAVTLRAMTEGVITTDVEGKILFINPAAANLTECDVYSAIGRPIEEICRFESTGTDAAVPVPVGRVAREDVVADLPLQTKLVALSGGRRQVEGCCAPIHAVDSKVVGAVLVFRDVTEHERLEQELVRATRLESVGILAGGIAHDFNNILTAVMGNLALALLETSPGSPLGASLRAAEKATLRARDLTHQLLTFAKGGEPVRAAVQLEAVVREMTDFALHGSQVKAYFDFAPDLWPADADKGQIGRVVQNLVINAVQAMPHGGTMRVSARNDDVDGLTRPGLIPGAYLQIAISDTGEGIKPEHLSRIFDPYFTTKQSGTGLGLAAVYSIVKKHRGHIDVESQEGVGTTFRIWLPALQGESARPELPAPISDTKLRGRVLFMDDEQIIRDMALILLRRFGLEAVCVADGAEAVENYRDALANGKPFDLVIMDLTVPGGMGGLAAVGKLREIDPHVKAVVSSGYSSDPVLANFQSHGFSAMVAKPYEISDLTRVLRELLPRNQASPREHVLDLRS